MKAVVQASVLEGRVKAPGSKSLMQRFVAAALMGRGTSIIRQPQESNDSIAALATAELLGAELAIDQEGSFHITGGKQDPHEVLNVGESGLSMRLFTAIAGMSGYEITLTGKGSLLERPVDAFIPVFEELGGMILTNNGKLPVTIKGPLKGGEAHLDGSVSSQFLSGLLMALPLAKSDSILHVRDLKSRPYIDMTIEVMERFGLVITHHNYERFHIPGGQHYKPADLICEGDWSGAAAMLVAGAVAGAPAVKTPVTGSGSVVVEGMSTTFTQADAMVSGALLFAGVKLMNLEGAIHVNKGKLRGFEFDATECPDLFPALAALATACDKPSKIHGIHRLKHKESDRAKVICHEFKKAGIRIELIDDNMIIYPGAVNPCTIDSHNDHRIAMAGAILGLRGGPVTILQAEAVAKSYSEFWNDLITLGANVRLKNN